MTRIIFKRFSDGTLIKKEFKPAPRFTFLASFNPVIRNFKTTANFK